jgi:23S rRNA pseudouridine2605 synthase
MIRIQKIIADSGFCSRRKAEVFIEQGLVKINGRPAKIGDKATPKDIITVDAKVIKGRTNLRYIKLYKPRGYVCTLSDPHAKAGRLITNLLASSGIKERVYPVGRLDANSEGLILLTNDGAFANKVTHPSNNYKKTYRVTVKGKVSENQVMLLSAGVDIGADGVREMTRPCAVEVVTEEEKRTVLSITISEGKNRQIRRMCAAVGFGEVLRLKRVSIGGVKLGMLAQGEFADLTKQELRLLGGDSK